MRILLAHCFYQQTGGEDRSFREKVRLLEDAGHEAVLFTLENRSIEGMDRLSLAARTLWSQRVYRDLRRVIRDCRPDVLHCLNTFPLISPAAYYAARAEGVPVVQTIRNYRVSCVRGDFHRNGAVCQSCRGSQVAWQGIWHRCYRDSLAASATVAALQTLHRLLGTWSRAVDQYIALSEFSRRTLIKCGLPAERISVKPNFLADPPPVALPDWLSSSERHVAGPRLPQSAEASAQDRVRGPHAVGDYALFAGRLSSEKGVDVLLRAWPHVAGRLPLKIAGDGPLAGQVREAAGSHGIEWLGEQPHQNVLTLLGKARCLIVPSTCFENFPRTIVESFAVGTPVIASRLGAMAELVTPGRNGWLFTSGSETELAAQVRAAVDTPLSVMRELRQNCRHEFEERYTPQVNYRLLMEIYRRAGVKRAEDPREQPHASLAMAEPRTAVGTEASLERTLPPRVAAHCGTDAPTHREEPCIS